VAGEGVLVLNLGQEIFAWQPHTGRYLQVTADDGRVLAFAQSTTGDKIVYVRAGRLIRQPGTPEALRSLSLRLLELPTMELSPPVDLPGDVRKVELWFPGAGMAALRVTSGTGEIQHFRFSGQRLETAPPSAPPPGTPTTVLTPDGVGPSSRRFATCAFSASDVAGKEESRSVRISVGKRTDALLDAKHGAGLYGLPFPK
jgi:hypothetical protein